MAPPDLVVLFLFASITITAVFAGDHSMSVRSAASAQLV
jgi:hypothetical protein